MAEMMDGIWELVEVLKSTPETPRANTTYATVTRVDKEGTVWVHIPGGAEETPANGLNVATVEPGDVVGISIAGNQANVTGNASSPAVGEREVALAVEPVSRVANNAEQAATSAEQAAQEAKEVAAATSQHFWYDDNGAHVSTEANNATGESNSLWNSLGLLIRNAANNLVSITKSAINFYDGNGNDTTNVLASFGASGAQIGRSTEANVQITPDATEFKIGQDTVSYISQDKMYFVNGEVGDSMYIGRYTIRIGDDGRFVIGLRY